MKNRTFRVFVLLTVGCSLLSGACSLRSVDPGTVSNGPSSGGTSTGNAVVKLHFRGFSQTGGSLWDHVIPSARAEMGLDSTLHLCVTELDLIGPEPITYPLPTPRWMTIDREHGGYGGMLELPAGDYSDVRLKLEPRCNGHTQSALLEGAPTLSTAETLFVSFAGDVEIRTTGTKLTLGPRPVVLHWESTQTLVDSPPGTATTDDAQPTGTVWDSNDAYGNFLFSADMRTIRGLTGDASIRATQTRTSGKFYWEITVEAQNYPAGLVGILNSTAGLNPSNMTSGGCGLLYSGAIVCASGGYPGTSGWSEMSNLGFAVDLDDHTFFARIDDVWVGNNDPFVGAIGFYFCPIGGCQAGATTYRPYAYPGSEPPMFINQMRANFGQDPFEHPIPPGFEAGW